MTRKPKYLERAWEVEEAVRSRRHFEVRGIEGVPAPPMADHTLRDCEKAAPPGFLLSPVRQNGERWTCSCGRAWKHVCDEAEGCYWQSETGKEKSK